MGGNKRKILTLCIIHQHPKVLLGMKKRGFGEGKWNGFGGKVEVGETIKEAAARELKEESGVEVKDIQKIGVIDFHFEGDPEILEVHIFKGENIEGEPRESEEMRPQWFHVDEIPYGDMWKDDKYWLPLLLENKKFCGKFLFSKSGDIVEMDLKEVDLI